MPMLIVFLVLLIVVLLILIRNLVIVPQAYAFVV